jgi:hypothetical protein
MVRVGGVVLWWMGRCVVDGHGDGSWCTVHGGRFIAVIPLFEHVFRTTQLLIAGEAFLS